MGEPWNICPHCGTSMWLDTGGGHCPKQGDGYHPVVVTYTTDNTLPPRNIDKEAE